MIVMADMVHKNDVLFQTGLAEADDEQENFDLMFQSLESIGEQ